MRAGILASPWVTSVIDLDALVRACGEAGLESRFLDAEGPLDFRGLDVIVSPLGPAYPQDAIGPLRAFHDAGGAILAFGPRPFTRPYRIDEGRLAALSETDAALHAFELPDTWVSTGPMTRFGELELDPVCESLRPRDGESFPALRETASLDLRVAVEPEKPADLYASHGRPIARFQPLCVIRDLAGRRQWAPLVRLDPYGKGSLVFFAAETQQPAFWRSRYGRRMLRELLLLAVRPQVEIVAEARYARYYPGEEPELEIRLRPLGRVDPRRPAALSVRVLEDGGNGAEIHRRAVECPAGATATVTLPVPARTEGFQGFRVQALAGDRLLAETSTGFYLYSDEAAQALARQPAATTLDPAIAPDFCLRKGAPWPMHGTTYIVSGRYRDCFSNHNVHTCRREMAELRSAGVNCLRTGVWTGYEQVFNADGTFQERSLRALDSYFLTAAEFDLPVHFVFAAFVMNHWDRSRDPFHDPGMMDKIRNQFRQFAARYRGWRHVVVDIINEPSYAPYRDGWMWQIARPMGSEHERQAWRQWLRERYRTLDNWREAWGKSAVDLPDWDAAQVPDVNDFQSHYDGPGRYDGRIMVGDFAAFAMDAFSRWCRAIRGIVRAEDPEMFVLLGRDETLRVPAQQIEYANGNIDFVNWHQWHREGTVFNEYVLNRVRGVPVCGQEMGVLVYKGLRNEERTGEIVCRNLLERKLLYCMGNWIQWQSHNDVSMDNVKEAKLGLVRADGTERAYLDVVRLLGWFEDRMAPHYVGRREDLEDIVILHPTTLYFSADGALAYRSVMQSLYALHFHLNRQANLVLEPHFRADRDALIGNPGLVVLPSPLMLEPETWRELLRRMREDGLTVVASGGLGHDPLARPREYLADLFDAPRTDLCATMEPVRIGRRVHTLTFRMALNLGLPAKGLTKTVPSVRETHRVEMVEVGKGTLIYCPAPIELGDEMEPVLDLYRLALRTARLAEPACDIAERDDSPAKFIYPIRYRGSTVYTLINEGPETEFRFVDRESGVAIRARVDKERGAKVVVRRDGTLAGACVHGRLQCGGLIFEPHGDAVLISEGASQVCFAGSRARPYVRLNGTRTAIGDNNVLKPVILGGAIL